MMAYSGKKCHTELVNFLNVTAEEEAVLFTFRRLFGQRFN
jgi:hypothetical protein